MICYECRYCIAGYEAEDSVCDRPRPAIRDVVTGQYQAQVGYCYNERYEGECGIEGRYFREAK